MALRAYVNSPGIGVPSYDWLGATNLIALMLHPEKEHILMSDSYYVNQMDEIFRLLTEYDATKLRLARSHHRG